MFPLLLIITPTILPTDRRGEAVLQIGWWGFDGEDGRWGDAGTEGESGQADAGERGTEQEDHREGKGNTRLPGEAQD